MEAIMAVLAVLVFTTTILALFVGAFPKPRLLSGGAGVTGRDDRTRGSLRYDTTSYSGQAARDLVGVSSSRWD
jgi:hypothetical protein